MTLRNTPRKILQGLGSIITRCSLLSAALILALALGLTACDQNEEGLINPDPLEDPTATETDARDITSLETLVFYPTPIKTLHSSRHALVRRVELPTRAALSRAFHLDNPLFITDPPAEERLAELRRITREDLQNWDTEIFMPGSLADTPQQTPLTEADERASVVWEPAQDYLEMEDEDLGQPMKSISATVAGERWGGTLRVQNLRRLLITNLDDPALMQLWVEIEFQPWAPVGEGITDSDGNGHPEVYLQLRPGALPPSTIAAIVNTFLGELLDEEQVKEFMEWVIGESYSQTNAAFRTSQFPEKFPNENVEEPVRQELGEFSVVNPTVVVRGKPTDEGGTWVVLIVEEAGREGADQAAAPAPPAPGEQADQAAPAQEQPSAAAAADEDAPGGERDLTSLEIRQKLGITLPEPTIEPVTKEEYRQRINQVLNSMPEEERGLVGYENTLFLRQSLQQQLDPQHFEDTYPAVAFFADLNRQLRERGVEFVYVSVPSKATVNPALAAGARPAELTNDIVRDLLEQMRTQGIEVIDLTDALENESTANFLKTDTHWTPAGVKVTAQKLAERAQAALGENAGQQNYTAETQEQRVVGDIARLMPPDYAQYFPAETVELEVVTDEAGNPVDTDSDESPLVMLGDSYTVIYESGGLHGKDAGLASHLSLETGVPVQLIAGQGAGAILVVDMARKMAMAAREGQDYLKNKKLVMFVMTERRLTDPEVTWETLDLPPAPEREAEEEPEEARDQAALPGIEEGQAPPEEAPQG
jgi:hypothetical protein